MKRIILSFLFFFISCNIKKEDSLTVSAAISLKDSLKEITILYQKKYPQKLYFNFGASGTLQKQISAGAPVDIYISASEKFMDILQNEGHILTGTRKILLENDLVLVTHKGSSFKISKLEDILQYPQLKIVIGNPDTVPAGKYAVETLQSLNLYAKIKSDLIYAENVRQAFNYVLTKEVDTGFVYYSGLYKSENKANLAYKIPSRLHKPITYPIAIIKDSAKIIKAEQFIKFLDSEEGKTIFKKYGFRIK